MEFKLEFKSDVKVKDLSCLTSNCIAMFASFLEYCRKHGLRCKLTSLKSDRENVKSVSNTHETGRAFDASVKGWSKEEIKDCLDYFNEHYKTIAAISYGDMKPRAVVYHDAGYGSHLHFQVRP